MKCVREGSGFIVNKGKPKPMGAVKSCRGINFSVAVPGDKSCSLLIYEKGKKEPCAEIPFPKNGNNGDICCMEIEGLESARHEYNYIIDGKVVQDPYATIIKGKEKWGREVPADKCRCGFLADSYDWEGDAPLKIPFEHAVMYSIHPRGFTMHPSSGVMQRGTFSGIKEKIPYLRELGINQLEFMPAYEFEEVAVIPEGAGPAETRLNYWGYGPGFYFAPKAGYAGKEGPEREFKDLVKTLHRNGIEVIMEFYFQTGTGHGMIMDCLEFWAIQYHVDGFCINADASPIAALAASPVLAKTKLFWEGASDSWLYPGDKKPYFRHLADCSSGFQTDIRRFLKGDEDHVSRMAYRSRRNSSKIGIINQITSHNGFTLADLVSYDIKHNEANGEDNKDGTDLNYSWNCGEEGGTRKKKIMELRKRQRKNALVMLLMSQGVPMLLGGDEMARSQGGNNNAYCQDNRISWIDWKNTEKNTEILEFTKGLLSFRKAHPILHMPEEMRLMDYKSCGYPDLSYHGEKAWYPDFGTYGRHLGIMYCGLYADRGNGRPDDFIYLAYNMHWDKQAFALPALPEGYMWRVAADTDADGIYEEGKEPILDNQRTIETGPRTTVILIGK